MRVLMIGGTGFLGYFTCRDLALRGHDVLALGLGAPDQGTMPGGVRCESCDVETCSDAELARVLAGADAVIHAAGAGMFADALGVSPDFVAADAAAERAAAETQRKRLAETGIQTGYDPADVARWQEEDLFLDPAPAMEALGYDADDIAAAIRDTVAATRRHGGHGPASLRKPA